MASYPVSYATFTRKHKRCKGDRKKSTWGRRAQLNDSDSGHATKTDTRASDLCRRILRNTYFT